MKKGVLITGGAKRLGKMMATSLGEEGYDILIHYNSSKGEAEKTKEEIEKKGIFVGLIERDLLKNSENFIEEALKIMPNLEILINSASVFEKEKISEVTGEKFFKVLKINSFVPLNLSIQWKEKVGKGIIINIIDARVHKNDFTHFSYGLSKKILYEITKSLALAFAPSIRVCGIAPGVFLPPEGEEEIYLKKILNLVPLERKGEISDLKKTLLFLIENDYLTGEVIYLDGGRHLVGLNYGKNLY